MTSYADAAAYQAAARDLAVRLVPALTDAGRTVAVAESLTGGLVVATLVSVPGASAVVRGGVVAYMTDVKTSVLGVDRGLLDLEGAVTPEVAREMARGVVALIGADYGVATTGVAGPDPQDGRPVGEVHVAVCGPRGRTHTQSPRLDPALGRDGIRWAAVHEALTALAHLTTP
ncbi:MAG TPA: CinA family protein [Candidatus Nanopelagicales bacterium]|nr:CinA family protein [Candidatus Nanopelagicales bacterium]